jgi:hypothetical protein
METAERLIVLHHGEAIGACFSGSTAKCVEAHCWDVLSFPAVSLTPSDFGGARAVSQACDCEHHTHDPSGTRKATEHEFGAAEAVVTVKSPWGGTFRLCRVCLEAGHIHGTQFR